MARPQLSFNARVKQYFKRKSRGAIVLDFAFVIIMALLLIPASRNAISRTIIRYSLFQPHENKSIKYLSNSFYSWKIQDVRTKKIITLDELKDKVLFVNFWATWCPPCVAEMPSIEKLNTLYGNKIAILLICDEPNATVLPFLSANGIRTPVYQSMSSVPLELASESFPTTFLISKNGRIVISRRGAAKWDGPVMSDLIEKLLKE